MTTCAMQADSKVRALHWTTQAKQRKQPMTTMPTALATRYEACSMALYTQPDKTCQRQPGNTPQLSALSWAGSARTATDAAATPASRGGPASTTPTHRSQKRLHRSAGETHYTKATPQTSTQWHAFPLRPRSNPAQEQGCVQYAPCACARHAPLLHIASVSTHTASRTAWFSVLCRTTNDRAPAATLQTSSTLPMPLSVTQPQTHHGSAHACSHALWHSLKVNSTCAGCAMACRLFQLLTRMSHSGMPSNSQIWAFQGAASSFSRRTAAATAGSLKVQPKQFSADKRPRPYALCSMHA